MPHDIYDLYNFEDQLEGAVAAAIKAVLAAQPLAVACQVLTTRDPAVKGTPRIEVNFSLSQAMTQRTAQGQAAPRQVPNAFEGTIAIVVASTRPLTTGNAVEHGKICGVVRFAMSAAARVFTDQSLPLLQVLECLPEAQSARVQDRKSQDLNLLNYHVWFAIRNGAWPAVPA